MVKAVKAIIFDCFGVLATDTWQAFLDSLPPKADIERARKAHRAYDSGLISKTESAKEIKAATGKSFVELEDMVGQQTAKNQQLLNAIRELHTNGYKVGMLSNVASNWIREDFLTREEQTLFDDFVFSYEIGLVKPDPDIFLLAAKRLHVAPDEMILVDDKELYCEAARKLNMRAICYKNFEQFKHELDTLL